MIVKPRLKKTYGVLLAILLIGTNVLCSDTNRAEIMASCTILPPLALPDLNDNLVTILDYDPSIIYTPETRIMVRMTTAMGLKARFSIDGIQNRKLFSFLEVTNGIYYGGYRVEDDDVKRNANLSVKLIDPLTGEEKDYTSARLLQIDHIIYQNEPGDSIVISRDDPRTRVYIQKDSLPEDVQMTIKRTNGFDKAIAYSFNMVSPGTGKPVTRFKKDNRIDIHFQVFNNDKIEEIGMDLKDISLLKIYSYDGVQWMPEGGNLDKFRQTLSATVGHFSIFAIREMDNIDFKIGPNPFTPNHDGINDEVKFSILSPGSEDARIRIFRLNGSLVRELKARTIQATTTIESSWDGLDSQGTQCGDGIYIYQIALTGKHYNGIVVLAR
jgi:hypothetical protein